MTPPSTTAVLIVLVLGLPLAARALEVNRASRAELEQLPGLGPAKVDRLLRERDRAAFTSWRDLARRVPGFGAKTSAALSHEGFTVNGQAFRAADARSDHKQPTPAR